MRSTSASTEGRIDSNDTSSFLMADALFSGYGCSLLLTSLDLLSVQSCFPQRSLGLPARSFRSEYVKPFAAAAVFRRSKLLPHFKVKAVVQESSSGGDEPKWWEKNAGPNMMDVHSTPEFLDALSGAGDKLVIVEFYGTWCASCRALFPKLCRTSEEHPDILFLKVNFDENKPMCKRLNVRVLPYFHFYRGADGLLESFSCSLAKFQKIKDAIKAHNTARCSIGPPLGVGDLNLVDGK